MKVNPLGIDMAYKETPYLYALLTEGKASPPQCAFCCFMMDCLIELIGEFSRIQFLCNMARHAEYLHLIGLIPKL